jgi:tetraacyldisaccharide 4'-kinase
LAPGHSPFGNGAVLPAGPLREPLAFHRLAHILVSTGDSAPSSELAALARGRPVFTAVHRPLGWRRLGTTELRPPEALAGRPVLAFCGLGRPDSFQRTLGDIGLDIRRFLALADHQVYSPRLLAGLGLAFTASGAEFMVTTAKDAVKLPPNWPWPVLILKTELRLNEPEGFFKAVLAALRLSDDRLSPG